MVRRLLHKRCLDFAVLASELRSTLQLHPWSSPCDASCVPAALLATLGDLNASCERKNDLRAAICNTASQIVSRPVYIRLFAVLDGLPSRRGASRPQGLPSSSPASGRYRVGGQLEVWSRSDCSWVAGVVEREVDDQVEVEAGTTYPHMARFRSGTEMAG